MTPVGYWVRRNYQLTTSQSAALDWLRGLAAQTVVLGHVLSASGLSPPHFFVQDLGVASFFILSGLLVTGSVMSKAGAYNFRQYFVARSARIFVPYVPAVALIVVVGWLLNLEGPIDAGTIAANLLLLEDFPLSRLTTWFPPIERVGTGRPLWSVAMEWWFYMAAAVLYFLGKQPLWSVPLVVAGIFVLIFNILVGTLGIVWLAGAVVAVALPSLPRAWPWKVVAGFLLGAALFRIIAVDWHFYDVHFALLLAAFMASSLVAIERDEWSERSATFAKLLAAYSYTLYLTHYTVMTAISDELLQGATRVAAVVVISNLVAISLWWLFERHHRSVASWLGKLLTVPRQDLPDRLS